MLKSIVGFIFAGVLLSASPVNVSQVSVGDGTNDSHYYVGPYVLSINGQNIDAICIDATHESDPGNQWIANLTLLSAGASAVPGLSNTYLGNAGLKQYEEEAYLFGLITQPALSDYNDPTRISIQHAMWDITDPGFVADPSAQQYMDLASANFRSINPKYFEIVSDLNTGEDRKQEFMISSAPEPVSLSLMGAGLFGLGLLRLRKKSA